MQKLSFWSEHEWIKALAKLWDAYCNLSSSSQRSIKAENFQSKLSYSFNNHDNSF